MPFYYQYIASSLPFSNPGLFTEDPLVGALRTQSTACEALGSYMYRDLFTALADDYEDGGRTYAILAGRSDRPVHDAIPLRLAGAIHKVVLEGLDRVWRATIRAWAVVPEKISQPTLLAT